jgi:hypothetical protein
MRSGFAGKCVPVASVSGWQAESQKRQLSVRDREDFRCSRSTAAQKITIHVRDREDFRCSRSTAARKITIHVRDKEDFRFSRSTAARKITINVGRRGGLQVHPGPQLHEKLP